MRLLAFLEGDVPTMGVVTDAGVVTLASLHDFYADVPGWLRRGAASSGEPARRIAGLTLIPPVPGTAKVVCAALNYASHAAETGGRLPEHPNLFARWAATLVPDGTPVPVPRTEPGLDWEVELAVVVGAPLIDVTPDEVAAGVLGYTVFNDLSAREHQRTSRQWALGKNSDRSGPVGSVIVTADSLDAGDLHLETRVNGEVMQSGSSADMIFSPAQLISYASRTITLRPGDLIATGTPPGVGFVREPPILLVPGDVVEVEVEGIGTVRTPIVDSSYRG
ncbi:MAG TPA: fumarylacetoacetate hydrolase family protein [Candidatus Dormibacteraeota bacterium]|nr:fumarylacetoacetate hydrolase family protein [Candidatus Dormibacteraeota bacterium]